MIESLPLSGPAVAWLQRLAREHENGTPVPSAADVRPPETARVLVSFGLVEAVGVGYRLTDLGWWALGHVVEDADA